MKKNIGRMLSFFFAVCFMLVAGHSLAETQNSGESDRNLIDESNDVISIDVVSDQEMELHIGIMNVEYASNYRYEYTFLAKYPNAKITYHLLTDEQLSTYLLANESRLDLLVLPQRLKEMLALQQRIVDLYEFSFVRDMPPELFEICGSYSDDELFGIPRMVQQFYFMWNEELANSIGASKPGKLWTWNDFLEMCLSLNFDVNGDGSKEFYLTTGVNHISGFSNYIDTFISDFINEQVHNGVKFHSEEFFNMVDLFSNIYRSGALADFTWIMPKFQGKDAVLMNRFDSSWFLLGENEYSFMTTPVLDASSPMYGGHVVFFTLMRNAPNHDAAMAFLSCVLDPVSHRMFASEAEMISTSLPQYSISPYNGYFDRFYTNEKGETVLTIDKNEQFDVMPINIYDYATEEELANYHFMKSHVVFDSPEYVRLYMLWIELIEQYEQGIVSKENLAGRLDDMYHMVVYE